MGGSNSNTSDHKIVVRDLIALAQVWVAPLDEGTEATVLSEQSDRWILQKDRGGLIVDGVAIVAPAAGAPVAGAAGAVWIREVSCGINQATQRVLLTDATTSSPITSILSPDLVLSIITSPAPVGGGLMIDFSGVFKLGLGTNPPPVEGHVYIFFDDVQVAAASMNGSTDPTIETLSMTLLLSPVAPGSHTVDVRWNVTEDAVFSSNPVTNPDRFFTNLRILEICSTAA